MLSSARIEQIILSLGSSAEQEIAFLERDGAIYFARQAKNAGRQPSSAVTRLIQGVWEREPDQARAVLRRRIYTDACPTELCLGMVRVAAKRLSSGLKAREHGIGCDELVWVDLSDACPDPAWDSDYVGKRIEEEGEAMALARALAQSVPREGLRHQLARPVGAVLVSEAGEVLAHSVNRNSRNRTRHAELSLVQALYIKTGRGLPSGARLYVTLKPCKMCAAAIWQMAEDRSRISVIYGEPDPGPNGRNTVLDRGSFERMRASGDAFERELEIQRPFACYFLRRTHL